MIDKNGMVRVVVGSIASVKETKGLGRTASFLNYITYDGGECWLDLNDDIERVISSLQKLNTKYKKEGYTDIQIDFISDGYSECSCSTKAVLKGTRKANQIEIDFYTATEEAKNAAKIERDREDYERLKAQFEKG